MLWLQKKLSPNQIDLFISAEIPDPVRDPKLHEIIKETMIHGPFGAHNPKCPCMKERKCIKRYPRAFVKENQTGNDGYPTYRRRSPEDGGFTLELCTVSAKKIRGGQEPSIDKLTNKCSLSRQFLNPSRQKFCSEKRRGAVMPIQKFVEIPFSVVSLAGGYLFLQK